MVRTSRELLESWTEWLQHHDERLERTVSQLANSNKARVFAVKDLEGGGVVLGVARVTEAAGSVEDLDEAAVVD